MKANAEMTNDQGKMTNDLPELDVFYGELTVNRALIYARLPRPADDTGLSLVGHVRGPRCLRAQTLPLTAPLTDLGQGPTLLARAIVPEPAFWSPDLPAIYDVTVHLRRGTETVATARREIGLKQFGVRGREFRLEGRPWVLRGVLSTSTTAKLPRVWHDSLAAFVTRSQPIVTDDELAEASQFGAFSVVVDIPRGEAGLRELRYVARHPSVAIVVQQLNFPPDFRANQVAANITVAQRIDAGDKLVRQPWANAFVANMTDASLLAQVSALAEIPVVVVRPLREPVPIAEARAACDQLQRDLAPIGQFAGYIV